VGIAELQLCRVERRLGGSDIGGTLLLGSLQDLELMLLLRDDSAARTNIGLCLGVGRGRLFEFLPRAGIGML